MSEDEKKAFPTAINLGSAKNGTLKIDGLTTIGEINGISAEKPEIGFASIDNVTAIIPTAHFQANDIAILLLNLKRYKIQNEKHKQDFEVIEKAITHGGVSKSILEKVFPVVKEICIKAKDKVTEELLNKAWLALLAAF